MIISFAWLALYGVVLGGTAGFTFAIIEVLINKFKESRKNA